MKREWKRERKGEDRLKFAERIKVVLL